MSEQIAKRIEKELNVPDLVTLLADNLSGSDLYSLLLATLKRRVKKVDPGHLSIFSPVTKPCDIDARLLNKVESVAYEIAANYKAIELAPLCPLGSVAKLSSLEQSNVLSTIKPFECASDPTIGMALESAKLRKNSADRKDTTRLCTSQRVIRLPIPANPAFTAHFKLFSLVNAGRDTGSFEFESSALNEHIVFYLDFLNALSTSGNFSFADITVEISDTRVVGYLCSKFAIDKEEIRSTVRARDSNTSQQILSKHAVSWPKTINEPSTDLLSFDLPEHMIKQLQILNQVVCSQLSSRYSHVGFSFNLHRLTGLGYYAGPCFHIKLKNSQGELFNLADGGFVDWTQLLLSDTKERLMTSAIGTELLCRMFREDQGVNQTK
ncbi:MAG: hypothetical protein P4L53_14825 [Candidatus Obscuribacterales bacterium]|nr:hypothetical protein [Candidatus Obscuribacterales bacterium]